MLVQRGAMTRSHRIASFPRSWHGKLLRRPFFAGAALLLLLVGGLVLAHLIVVDGDLAGDDEWSMTPPDNVNTGHIGRNASFHGEYIWKDAAGDQRTVFGGGDPHAGVDITELRITSDATFLYFLVKMSDITVTTGEGAPQVQIAIDRDHVAASGNEWFGKWSETQVVAAAEWEYLVVAAFGSAHDPYVYDTNWADRNAAPPDPKAEAVISAVNDIVEIKVPWAIIGGAPAAPLYFSVISAQCDGGAENNTREAFGSDAIDVVTNYGNPGLTDNSWTELEDGYIDYHFVVWFHLDGGDPEPSPPLVLNEAMWDPQSEPGGEWVEIYNRTGGALSLDGYRLSDSATVDAGEGTKQFPAGQSIAPAATKVVANQATAFFQAHGYAPSYEFGDTDAAVPEMSTDSAWSSGTTLELVNDGDELLLLDPCYTVIDALSWGDGGYPGVSDAPVAGDGQSVERRQPTKDTN
ncbi:MAG: hypothetical protein FJ125_06175, partial [Deltaproteobacteria bacterium]|nr:hypothetical protein [Deltaproteobacteria bacterium]